MVIVEFGLVVLTCIKNWHFRANMQHQVQVQLGKQIRVMENRLDKVTW